MGIVLSKAAHPHKTVKLTALLVAVNQAQLAYPKRQIPVRVRLGLVNQHAAGTVHGLNRVVLLIDHCGIHIVLIVIPVSGGLPQLPA